MITDLEHDVHSLYDQSQSQSQQPHHNSYRENSNSNSNNDENTSTSTSTSTAAASTAASTATTNNHNDDQTHDQLEILSLLNDKVLQLQTIYEMHRVNAILETMNNHNNELDEQQQQHQQQQPRRHEIDVEEKEQKVEEEEEKLQKQQLLLNKQQQFITSSTNETCLLCTQSFPMDHKKYYNHHQYYEYFTCCGNAICKSCFDTFVIKQEEAVVVVEHQNYNHVSTECKALLHNRVCPFCTKPWPQNEFDDSQRILQLAQKGHGWAQIEIAKRFEHGMGVEPSEEMAAAWFSKAAREGNACGQYHIGRFLKWGLIGVSYLVGGDGGEEVEEERGGRYGGHDDDDDDDDDDDKLSYQLAKQYYEKAAIQGHAKAQHDLATLLLDECELKQDDCVCDDALHWYTLSLLQHCDEAYYSLGNLYLMKGKMKVDKLEKAFDFGRAVYWLKQSAEKGSNRGQMLLGLALLENAKNLYGNNICDYTCAGFNIVPQVFYWLRKSSFNGSLDAGTRLINYQNVHLKQCACCHKTGECKWRKCEYCYGVSYCSESCMTNDWEAGHKIDCYEDPLMSTKNAIQGLSLSNHSTKIEIKLEIK